MSEPIPKGRVIEGNFAKELDSRFLNANWFLGKGTIALTIDRIEHHDEFTFQNGSKEKDLNFCYFKEIDKPLSLCKTNSNSIMMLADSCDPKDIYGKKFGFLSRKETYFGETRPCVRLDHDYKPTKTKEDK